MDVTCSKLRWKIVCAISYCIMIVYARFEIEIMFYNGIVSIQSKSLEIEWGYYIYIYKIEIRIDYNEIYWRRYACLSSFEETVNPNFYEIFHSMLFD